MNDEERQRQMDFILNQQAQFAADIQSLKEMQARTEESLVKTNEALARTIGALDRLAELTINGFQELRQITAEHDAKIAELDARHKERAAEMDERLDRMILIVERHISEGYHGQSQTE